mgnify:CR=1 FL=1
MIVAITLECAKLLSIDKTTRTVYIEADPRSTAVQFTIEARPATTVAEFNATNAQTKNVWTFVGPRGGLTFIK